ncbi:DUF222 domain-containing protein [Rhodococcus sp. MALMAid1271]|uniref:HNH endonuclease signature motif containing protein n=1 Tax=Rhodococcus sp. MALMAid1271 TaxID=3411744 RepID=UPI003BA3491C
MAVPTVSLEALAAAAREENRHAARKIAACYRVHTDWITRDTEHKHYSRYGRTEMALALGCSATVAEGYISVAVALHTRLPLIKDAFEAGEIDFPRVRTACRILDNLSDTIVASVEGEVVDAARRSSPGPLETQIWDILLRVAPQEAAALRKFAKRFRTVTYSPAGELARIRAELTAPEAAAAWQLLAEMADTVCPKDPRGRQERLCDAFMARMHGEPRLECLCQRTDCPRAGAVPADRRRPLTMITVDIATLIGLLANPAYLAGHGCIDPELARELARNSTWQILLTDAVTLAEKLGLAHQNPETRQWERHTDSEKTPAAPSPETATDTDADRDPDTAADADADADADEGIASASTPAAENTPETGPATPPAPADETEETEENSESADESEEAERKGETEGNGESTPACATDPSATPAPDADPVRKHAATRVAVPAPDPLAEAPSATGPEADAASEPTSAESASASPKYSESDSSTTTLSSAPSDLRPVNDPAPETPPAPAPAPDSTAATASETSRRHRLQSLASAAARFCTHTPVGKGTRHSSALDLPTLDLPTLEAATSNHPDRATHRTPSGIYLGNASLTAALEAAIAADPTLGRSVGRDPLTDRALIYRPDALTTAAVRLRDRHCRFPDCRRPAAHCQLDHITAFDHTNPFAGGWTTLSNLQCLCEYHHTVKTVGYWKATMLPGGAILWTSTSKTTRITLPANATTIPILGNDLRPDIPTQPRRSGIIAYPHPPDNEQSDTDDTTTPPF